jgi:hypothetical protein
MQSSAEGGEEEEEGAGNLSLLGDFAFSDDDAVV